MIDVGMIGEQGCRLQDVKQEVRKDVLIEYFIFYLCFEENLLVASTSVQLVPGIWINCTFAMQATVSSDEILALNTIYVL